MKNNTAKPKYPIIFREICRGICFSFFIKIRFPFYSDYSPCLRTTFSALSSRSAIASARWSANSSICLLGSLDGILIGSPNTRHTLLVTLQQGKYRYILSVPEAKQKLFFRAVKSFQTLTILKTNPLTCDTAFSRMPPRKNSHSSAPDIFNILSCEKIFVKILCLQHNAL